MQYYSLAAPEIVHNFPERFTPAFLAVFARTRRGLRRAGGPLVKWGAETAAFFVNRLFASPAAAGV
jgi:hypothetical protein